jgi:hypothetical protein
VRPISTDGYTSLVGTSSLPPARRQVRITTNRVAWTRKKAAPAPRSCRDGPDRDWLARRRRRHRQSSQLSGLPDHPRPTAVTGNVAQVADATTKWSGDGYLGWGLGHHDQKLRLGLNPVQAASLAPPALSPSSPEAAGSQGPNIGTYSDEQSGGPGRPASVIAAESSGRPGRQRHPDPATGRVSRWLLLGLQPVLPSSIFTVETDYGA